MAAPAAPAYVSSPAGEPIVSTDTAATSASTIERTLLTVDQIQSSVDEYP